MNSGIINVYKEAGYTSFDVVARLRGILKIKKIGHTGTLDPDAVGVLPICVGKGTGLVEMLTDHDKVYESVFLLGKTTDTLDISGEVLAEGDYSKVTEADIKVALSKLTGEIEQIPPMYSALKVNGQKLCDLARKGVEVERKARRVMVYSIDILDVSLPEIRVRIHCGKGCYIRSICDDMGRFLGCGACMKSLVRSRVANFDIENAYKLDEIEALKNANDFSFMSPVDSVFAELDAYTVTEQGEKTAVNGGILWPSEIVPCDSDGIAHKNTSEARLYLRDGRFLGIYTIGDKEVRLKRFFLEQ